MQKVLPNFGSRLNELNIRINEGFAVLQNLCVPALKGPLFSLRLIFPGPELIGIGTDFFDMNFCV